MFSRIVRSFALLGVALSLVACASTPRFQGMSAGELWVLAQREFEDGDFSEAAEVIEHLQAVSTTFERAADAQLLLARAYFEDGQFITAQSEYVFFLDRYPQHPSVPDAALGVCRSNEALSPITQRDQTFTRQALQVCANVAADYAGSPQGAEAATIAAEMRDKLGKKTYDVGADYLRRNFLDPAIIYFDLVLEEFPGTRWAPRALAGLLEAYEALGYEEEFEETRQRLLTGYPDSPEARRVENGGGGDSASDVGR